MVSISTDRTVDSQHVGKVKQDHARRCFFQVTVEAVDAAPARRLGALTKCYRPHVCVDNLTDIRALGASAAETL